MPVNQFSVAEEAVAVPSRIVAAWEKNDGDAFADTFTEDGTMILPGDVFLTGREQIRAFMRQAYAGPYSGTRVFGEPLSVRAVGEDVVVVVTRGGVLAPGETEVAPERTIRATWVIGREDGQWLVAAYQNTPVGA
ncbi:MULTISPECIES: SgcJ/EcaC family oxidoreductase [Micromonospora]|uniref:SgcJ/EcaC family oxidoreductase n=1 Tax=Micromonospora TaxID=1873 RepID=UPI0006AE1F48|nr:SgcJ/EcaC family oxidoreductase [Micromonospora sp. NRRL B-16802]KOX03255.1 hypothetical protein ADK66_28490 [Micromonospora sp. NRRL B-16802]